MGSQVIKYSDEPKKLTENAFIWDAHTFSGWNTESDGTGDSFSDEGEVPAGLILNNESTLELYAQWTAP